MKGALFAYSRQGCQTARRIMAVLSGEVCAYTAARLEERDFLPLPTPSKPLYGECFAWADTMIFVGSCGIAVREIAPYVRDKRTDPAVICVDELGRFVIPLLSGHIGGANALAAELAEALQATAVITTATDIHGKFSVDAWAARQGYAIDSMAAAKAVSAAILEGEVPLKSDFPIVTSLPRGTVSGNEGEVGIYLTYGKAAPFTTTLRLIPAVLHVGIGCRRGTEEAAIATAVETVLHQHGIDRRAIKCVASIDLKAEEQGLLDYCKAQHWPITFYTAEELAAVTGEFTPSEFVKSIAGVDNVCERAALLGAEKLIVKKTAVNGVTVAVACEHWEVHFG